MGSSLPENQPSRALREAAWRSYVERCAARDQAALAALYDESSGLVYTLVLRMLGDAADAEEVTMDVYSQVWRSAAGYDAARGTVAAWLVAMARSRALDKIRSRSGRVQREQPLMEIEETAAWAASPESDAEASQRRRHVFVALASLPPEQSQAVQLAFFSGLTHSELAERLGQPLGTVKTRIRQGMMKLRDQLGVYAAS